MMPVSWEDVQTKLMPKLDSDAQARMRRIYLNQPEIWKMAETNPRAYVELKRKVMSRPVGMLNKAVEMLSPMLIMNIAQESDQYNNPVLNVLAKFGKVAQRSFGGVSEGAAFDARQIAALAKGAGQLGQFGLNKAFGDIMQRSASRAGSAIESLASMSAEERAIRNIIPSVSSNFNPGLRPSNPIALGGNVKEVARFGGTQPRLLSLPEHATPPPGRRYFDVTSEVGPGTVVYSPPKAREYPLYQYPISDPASQLINPGTMTRKVTPGKSLSYNQQIQEVFVPQIKEYIGPERIKHVAAKPSVKPLYSGVTEPTSELAKSIKPIPKPYETDEMLSLRGLLRDKYANLKADKDTPKIKRIVNERLRGKNEEELTKMFGGRIDLEKKRLWDQVEQDRRLYRNEKLREQHGIKSELPISNTTTTEPPVGLEEARTYKQNLAPE